MTSVPPSAPGAFALVCCLAPLAFADEATIRKNIAERLPDFPKIDEVTKTPIPGIFELRVGTDILYTDEQGSHLFEGHLIDTQDARQPHRGARGQADGDRLQEHAAQGCARLEAGHRRAQAGRSSPTRTAATARSSSATCRR